jgi:integrase
MSSSIVLVQSQHELSNRNDFSRRGEKEKRQVKEPYLYGFDKQKNPRTAVFLEELRTDATRRNYARDIVLILKNESDAFLDRSKQEKQSIIRAYIITNRGKISDSYLCSSLVAIKSLLARYEQEVNWFQIKRMLPKVKHAARDRAPTKEEIRKLLKFCDLRLRAAVFVLASCGIRAGGLVGLLVGDYSKFDWQGNKLGKLVVYRGTAEEYLTLISPEAVQALDEYLQFRVSKGAELSNGRKGR